MTGKGHLLSAHPWFPRLSLRRVSFVGLAIVLAFSATKAHASPDLMNGGTPSSAPYMNVYCPGEYVTFSYKVRNNNCCGVCGDDAGAFKVRFYLSSDTTINTSDYFLKEASWTGLGNCTTIENSETDVQVPVGIPAGVYYVGWIIDPLNQVSESNESNNTGYDSRTISLPAPGNTYCSQPTTIVSGVDYGACLAVNGGANGLSSCGGGGYNDAWWRFQPTSDSAARVYARGANLENPVDCVLSIYHQSCDTSDLYEVACADDTGAGDWEQINFHVDSGCYYYIRVASYHNIGGLVQVHLDLYQNSYWPALSHDLCTETNRAISTNGSQDCVSLEGCRNDIWSTSCWGSVGTACKWPEAWWTLVAPYNGRATVSHSATVNGSSVNSRMMALSSCGNTTPIQCDNSSGSIQFEVTGGNTYYIAVAADSFRSDKASVCLSATVASSSTSSTSTSSTRTSSSTSTTSSRTSTTTSTTSTILPTSTSSTTSTIAPSTSTSSSSSSRSSTSTTSSTGTTSSSASTTSSRLPTSSTSSTTSTSQGPTVTLIHPSTNELIVIGTTYRFSWTASGISNPIWKFFLNKDGAFYQQQYPAPVNDGGGNWHADWFVPSYEQVCTYQLYLKDDSTTAGDTSGNFCLSNAATSTTSSVPSSSTSSTRSTSSSTTTSTGTSTSSSTTTTSSMIGPGSQCTNCLIVTFPFSGTTSDNVADGLVSACNQNDTIAEWICYTAPCSGQALASTCNSSMDTVLGVYSQCGTPLGEICNDDWPSCGPSSLQSGVPFSVTAGQTYYIRVSGANGITGNYMLDVACTPSTTSIATSSTSSVATSSTRSSTTRSTTSTTSTVVPTSTSSTTSSVGTTSFASTSTTVSTTSTSVPTTFSTTSTTEEPPPPFTLPFCPSFGAAQALAMLSFLVLSKRAIEGVTWRR